MAFRLPLDEASEVWRRTVSRVPPWSVLKHLGDSRLLKSSYVWMFVLPLMAKVLDKLPPQVETSIYGRNISIQLALPFSWTVLFFAALAATIANLVYIFACPAIVKRYRTFAEFQAEGRGPSELKTFFIDLLQKYTKSQSDFEAASSAQHFMRQYCDPPAIANRQLSPPQAAPAPSATLPPRFEAIRQLQQFTVREATLADAFWYTRNLADKFAALWRLICLGIYTVAFALALLIVIQNICSVIEIVFPSCRAYCSVIKGERHMPIPFEGTFSLQGNKVELRPHADPRVRIIVDATDASVVRGIVEIREGARADIQLPDDPALRRQYVSSPECQGGPTCCIGGSLFCCDTGIAVKSCNGLWYCP